MPKLKNIIFDLGGVLVNIDYHKTIAAFEGMGVKNFKEMFTQYSANSFFEGVETGDVSEALFYSTVNGVLPQPAPEATIRDAWNAMLLSYRKETLPVLKDLSKKYQLFLLSNTNSIHLKYIREVFTRDTGEASLDAYFTKSWYSHLVGLRKPYKEIYEFALKDGGIIAAETLFIDDTINNIETARALGIRCHHLQPLENIGELDYGRL